MAASFPLEFRTHEGIIWKSLLEWRDKKTRYPTIAGTIPNSCLQGGVQSFDDVGLRPTHGHSILDVQEIHSIDKATKYKYAVRNELYSSYFHGNMGISRRKSQMTEDFQV